VEAFLATEADKKHYLQLARRVARLFKAILPDPTANELAPLAVRWRHGPLRVLPPSADHAVPLGAAARGQLHRAH